MKIVIDTCAFGHDSELGLAFDVAYRNATRGGGSIDFIANGQTVASGVETDRFARELEALAFDAPKGTAVQRGARKLLLTLAAIGIDAMVTDACGA